MSAITPGAFLIRERMPQNARNIIKYGLAPLVLGLASPGGAATPADKTAPWLPPWPSTYDMRSSTILQPSNTEGFLDNASATQWGIIDLDWENARKLWANDLSQKPGRATSTCENRMIQQVEKLKAARKERGPRFNGTSWVYRNVVKADNWFDDVRTVLDNPQYAGWFVGFDPAKLKSNSTGSPPCDNNFSPPKCSSFYHDQVLTPNVPASHPKPAGACVGACDCGAHPCGEYVFDHRNASLRKWLLEQYIGGPAGMGHPDVEGMFLDDIWDAVKGPSEFSPSPVQDMGLSQADVKEMTAAWAQNQVAVHKQIIAMGGFDWALFNCDTAPNATHPRWNPAQTAPGRSQTDPKTGCAAWLRGACTSAAPLGKQALFFGFTRVLHRQIVHRERAAASADAGPRNLPACAGAVRLARPRLDRQRRPLHRLVVSTLRSGLRDAAHGLVRRGQHEAGCLPAVLDERRSGDGLRRMDREDHDEELNGSAFS